MIEQKMSKIGARCLTEDEATAILPTYDKIYEQIELFRNSKNLTSQEGEANSKNIEKEYIQKTNNIGIIGVRGAGKTSVLKTIRQKLIEEDNKSDNRRDIILPIIIPENMSESSTLMATVLGMINEVVKKKEDEYKDKKDGKCIKKGEVLKKFESVIKQYTFIQKEYRDILIREYTTESDYIKDSAKVFSSDTEFIKKFNELVDKLIIKQDGLLFLFIDDIDLSTHRCAEVVKTLLSYLSNQSIVTFISGDLDTFEEALTLDFLRQEKVLDADMLEKSMLSGRNREKTLLDSKKQLSYEYLKKILPPGYRHNIKQWSLEEKAGYGITDKENNKETLSELLVRALDGWVDPLFFYYSREDIKQTMPYTYHLFDDTSRGLNNVYNILTEIAEKRKNEKKIDLSGKKAEEREKEILKDKKQLIDTIVASKSIYNKYRNEINKNMIIISENKESSKIFFDNAYAFIYEEKINRSNAKTQKQESHLLTKYVIEDPVERFSLFILVDFSARLLYEDNYDSLVLSEENYKNLKAKSMTDLFFNPIIAEKILKNSVCDIEYPIKYCGKRRTLYDMNVTFLTKGDLLFNLSYYKNIPIESIWMLFSEQKKDGFEKDLGNMSLKQECIIAFEKTVSFISGEKKEINEVLVNYYPTFWKEFEYIRNQLSSSNVQNIVMNLFDKECEECTEENEKKRILLNTIAEYLKKEDKDEVDEELKINDLIEENSKEEKRMVILKQIDLENLWNEDVVESVGLYIEKEIKHFIKRIDSAIGIRINREFLVRENSLLIKTKDAYEFWVKFDQSDDGVSQTKAKKTKSAIESIIKSDRANLVPEKSNLQRVQNYQQNEQDILTNGILYDTYVKIIEEGNKLASNSRVRYGRYEVLEFLHALQKSPIKITDILEVSEEYFKFLLQCSYKYKKAKGLTEKAMEYVGILKKLSEELSMANKNADEKALDSFMKKLNKNLEKEITKDEFEDLFQ